jgi:hypothetical protein
MRWLAALLMAAIALLSCPPADADIGGQIPAPGLCEYPGVGGSGMAGALVPAYWYWCDFPVELNGSHWHCQYAGAAGIGTIGVSMIFQAGIAGPVGGMVGGCAFLCPDMRLAASPNPPGGWKDAIRPTRCQPIGLNPFAPPPPPEDVPISPPIAEQGAIPSKPFDQPAETPPTTGSPAEILPSVTNPSCPNPDATTNATCAGDTK